MTALERRKEEIEKQRAQRRIDMPWSVSLFDGLHAEGLEPAITYAEEGGHVFGKPADRSGLFRPILKADLSSGQTDAERVDIMRRAFQQKIIRRKTK